ncbi:MAG: cytochrome c-type biogenesis protein CcmH [Proteobacteria bacterium]|jgi:cytochrome c-type biogenesis protein CcmH|nr:cytochrome c-type biogenesis protein CcmH [Pseudomonadota bacterium]MDA0881524.1 cytochrome c-type biogenesis protein CcmH [Pseudomonadota bacterium]MDP5038375.1 cytochrome c-type biogenesis protein CcmH [SAR86 cluster bacterium]
MTASALIYLFLFSMSNGLHAEAIYMFDDDSEEKRFYSLISEIRCPKCTSGSIASSDVPVSRDLKQRVYELIKSGSSNEEIKDYVKQRFGESSDYKPAFDGFNYILWLGPFIFLALLMTIFYSKRRL